MTRKRIGILCLAMMLTLLSAITAMAALQVIDSFYRPDRMLPEWNVFWTATEYKPGDALPTINGGGALCIYVRNSGAADVTISDVTINGQSLESAFGCSGTSRCNASTCSVYYTSNQTLIDAGVPVWWRVDPGTISPGQVAQVYIYMRKRVSTTLSVVVVPTAGGSASTSITVSSNDVPRIAGYAVSPDYNQLYLYLRHPQRGKFPTQILVDNQDVTSYSTIGADTDIDLVPVKVNLSSNFVRGSFHSFQAVYDDGSKATDGLRVFYDDFMYGLWGEPNNLSTTQEQHDYLVDMGRHSITRCEYGCGTVMGYGNSAEGQQLMAEMGIWQDTDQLAFWGRTYSLMLCDEPDAGDINAPPSVAPTDADKPGTMALSLSRKAQSWKATYPTYPIWVNIDENYKPYAWYIYGQLTDIFSVDPYYHNALSDVYYSRYWKFPIYRKTIYQYATCSTANAGCEPRPLKVIIATGRYQQGSSIFRWLTSEEDRLCAYYSIAAGAKQLGYWWMSPIGPSAEGYNGIGSANQPRSAALWREIGLVGAELGTVSPVLEKSCPVDMPITTSTGRLWTKALLSGLDTMMLVCINDDHANDRAGTVVRSIDDVDVSFDLPVWLTTPANVFEVDYNGIHDVSFNLTSGRITLDLGRTDLTRMIIITSDSKLKSAIQSRYNSTYGPRVDELIP